MVFIEQLKTDLQLLLVGAIVFGLIILVLGSFFGGTTFSFLDNFGFANEEFGYIGMEVIFGFVVMVFLIMGVLAYHKHFVD